MPKRFFHAWAGTFITNIGIVLCGFITGILTARFLHPDGRGALAAVIYWPQLFASIGILSIHEATTYRISQSPKNKNLIIAASFWLAILLSVIVVFITYLAIPLLLDFKRENLWNLSRFYLLFYTPFYYILLVLLASDQGQLKFSLYNSLRFLVPSIYLIGILLLWLSGNITIFWVVIINALAVVFVAILKMILTENLFYFRSLLSEFRHLIKIGWNFHIVTVLTVASLHADRFVILKLWDNRKLGLYMAALTIAASGLNVVSQAFYTVLFPTIASTPADKQVRLLEGGIRQAMLLLFSVTIPLVMVSHWLVPFLFGKEFELAGNIAIFLLMAFLIISLKKIIIRSLWGMGKGFPGAVAEGISLTLFIVIVWPFSNILGIHAIAFSLLIGNSVALLYLFYNLRRYFNIEFKNCWGLTIETTHLLSQSIKNYISRENTGLIN